MKKNICIAAQVTLANIFVKCYVTDIKKDFILRVIVNPFMTLFVNMKYSSQLDVYLNFKQRMLSIFLLTVVVVI